VRRGLDLLRKIATSQDRKMKILLVRLGALGDIVHALPVAAALRERYPDAQIDWLVDARHASLLDIVPVISRRVVVDSRRWGAALGALRALRREGYHVAVDLQGLVKSAAFARMSGAPRVIGFSRAHLREKLAAGFYSEACDPGDVSHVVDKNLSVLALFGIAGRRRQFPIAVPESAACEPVVERVRRDRMSGYALVNAGAAWPNKQWPPARFGEVAAALATRHALLPVVLWGPGEQAIAAGVVEASNGIAMAAPPTGIGDLLTLARGARLMLSGDTGPLHLAAAVGAPIVALFGPTDPARNGPWDAADISLSRFGDCVCHYERRCRRSRGCIEDLTVEDVRAAIDRRLATAKPHA
jgi:lipopolysaccharide heptosyltransferase I